MEGHAQSPTREFNEFLYECLRFFLISENSLKFANFFAEVTNSRSMPRSTLGVPPGNSLRGPPRNFPGATATSSRETPNRSSLRASIRSNLGAPIGSSHEELTSRLLPMETPTGANRSCYRASRGAPRDILIRARKLLLMEAPSGLLLEALLVQWQDP